MSHRAEQFRKARERGDCAQPLLRFEGRAPGNAGTGGHIASDSALRVHDGVLVHGQVAGHSDLPGQQHVALENARAGESGLRTDDVVFADDAGVSHLDQAVDLRAALNASLTHGGAVDRGERLYLDVVFDHSNPGLHDLVVRAVRALSEAVSVAADNDPVLQDHTIADAAVFAHGDVRMRVEIVADLGAFVDDHVRMQDRVAADACARADDGKGPDRGVVSDFGVAGDAGE